MKKIKKSLSLLISLIMILSGVGMMSASVSSATLKPEVYPDLKAPLSVPATLSKIPEEISKFTPKLINEVPAEGAPIIYEFTKTAAADESIVISGENLTEDTRFILYSQTTAKDGAYYELIIQRLEPTRKAIVTLPENLTYSMYMIWAMNEHGTSYPILINKTEKWWLGEESALPSQTVSVYGTNLTKKNTQSGEDDASYIYLESSDGEQSGWANVTKMNPNKVEFTVPDFPEGSYNVWIHNGNGGAYGFGLAGTFRISEPALLPAVVIPPINVKEFGAAGDGETDDTDAILSAFKAAQAMDSIYFPEGEYIFNGTAVLKNNTKIYGDGTDKTFIYTDSAVNMVFNARDKEHISISDMTFDCEKMDVGNSRLQGVLAFSGSKYINVNNVDIFGRRNDRAIGSGTNDFMTGDFLRFKDCTFQTSGFACVLTMSSFKNCDFIGRGRNDQTIHSWSSSKFVIESCTYRDFNPDITDGNEDSHMRFYVENNAWGVGQNQYIADNQLYGVGSHASNWEQNAGEIILFESAWGKKLGYPTEVTETSFTPTTTIFVSDRASWFLQWTSEIYITSGTGAGQRRHIRSGADHVNDGKPRPIIVDRPWDVMPDETSFMVLTLGARYCAVRDNYVQGESNYATQDTASCGVSLFDTTHDMVIANNTFENMRSGFVMFSNWNRNADPAQIEKGSGVGIITFNLFTDNTVLNSFSGIRIASHDFDNPNAQGFIDEDIIHDWSNGNIVRRTHAINLANAGIDFGAGYLDNAWNVYEQNTFENTRQGLHLGTYGGDIRRKWSGLFYKNNFIKGDAIGDSILFNFTGNNKNYYDIMFRENTYDGFNRYTSGNSSGAFLQVPYRSFDITNEKSTSKDIEIWNSGVVKLDWEASTDCEWITINVESGTIENQQDKDTVSITVNPDMASSDDETGKIYISGGEGEPITVFIYLVDIKFYIEKYESNIFTVKDRNTLTVNTNIKDSAIVWSSSDDSVISIDVDGNWQALKHGAATITAKAAGYDYFDSYELVIYAQKGDIDLDGEISISDAVLIFRILADKIDINTLTEEQLRTVNGKVDIQEAIYIFKVLAGKIQAS